MKITLIGAGNLATNLGAALHQAGHQIQQVYSRTEESASRLGRLLEASWTTDMAQVNAESDVYILSVKDSVLQELADQLLVPPTSLVLHTAGSMSIDTLPQKHRGVLYPMQTFSKTRLVNFREIPCFLETAEAEDIGLLRELAGSISDKLYTLPSDQRRFLHLSAVFACNFVNHCYDLSAQILAQHDIPFQVMLPLIDETARKVHTLAPNEAQTGPAVRWDENVIARQIYLLRDNPTIQHIYEEMSDSIHESHTKK